MSKKWKWLRVPEDTQKLARMMAAERGMKINDFVQMSLENSKHERIDKDQKKRRNGGNIFDFGI